MHGVHMHRCIYDYGHSFHISYFFISRLVLHTRISSRLVAHAVFSVNVTSEWIIQICHKGLHVIHSLVVYT